GVRGAGRARHRLRRRGHGARGGGRVEVRRVLAGAAGDNSSGAGAAMTEPGEVQQAPPGVSVAWRSAAVREVAGPAAGKLAGGGVPAAVAAKNPGLWGPDAAAEAAIRLSWLDAPRVSRALLGPLAALAGDVRGAGLDHFVLCGMGGSSLAPEVISRTAKVPLTVLDTTDPHTVRRALSDRLAATLVVVSSKSGSTIETDSHRRGGEKGLPPLRPSSPEDGPPVVGGARPPSPPEAPAPRGPGYTRVRQPA